jgi:hypothetical protein
MCGAPSWRLFTRASRTCCAPPSASALRASCISATGSWMRACGVLRALLARYVHSGPAELRFIVRTASLAIDREAVVRCPWRAGATHANQPAAFHRLRPCAPRRAGFSAPRSHRRPRGWARPIDRPPQARRASAPPRTRCGTSRRRSPLVAVRGRLDRDEAGEAGGDDAHGARG